MSDERSKPPAHLTNGAPPQSEARSFDFNQALLRRGLLEYKDLELASHYQKKMAARGHPSTLNQVLVDLGLIERETLEQVLTEEENARKAQPELTPEGIEELVQKRTHLLEKQLAQIRAADEIARSAATASTLYELLHRTTHQVVERFNLDCVAVFLEDDTGLRVVLQQAAFSEGQGLSPKEYKVQIGAMTGVGQSAANNLMMVTADISPVAHNASEYLLAEARAEACLPISVDDKVLGVLETQSIKANAFDTNLLNVLQTIAGHLAPVIQHFRSQETTQAILGELSVLYQTSQSMVQAKTSEDILNQIAKTLKQSPLISFVLQSEGDRMRLLARTDPDPTGFSARLLPDLFDIAPRQIEHYLFIHEYLITYEISPATGMPESLRNLAKQLGCKTAAFIPIRKNNQLEALIVLGSNGGDEISHKTLQLYVSLANIITTALERVQSLENIERRLNRLQVLDSVSQAITLETDLDHLYRVIHQQITQVMGEVNFLIALYEPTSNLIEIPYAYENDAVLSIPPFPLGEGLTSILLRTKQPLLLDDNAEKRAADLGAKVVGAPAKSWLGVPLLVGGEAIGAIIIQDLEREHRFDEDDQRLLSNLASQVAITVRNARLINETRLLAENESAAKDIANKLWTSSDIDTILSTAIYELGKTLKASKGLVQLELDGNEMGYQ